MNYYINIVSGLSFNAQHNAYSGTLNGCDIDIVKRGLFWSCEVTVDGTSTIGKGLDPAYALKNAVAF